MDRINADMKEAEKHITGMEKWCGLCVCPWNRNRKIRDNDAKWNKEDKKGKNGETGAVNRQPGPGAVMADGPMIQRINNDAREDEMEDNLQAVGGMLSGLKNMAQDMNSELDKQNKQLDRMNDKVEEIFSLSFFLFVLLTLSLFSLPSVNTEQRGRLEDQPGQQEDGEAAQVGLKATKSIQRVKTQKTSQPRSISVPLILISLA